MGDKWRETPYGPFAADFGESRLVDLCDPEAGIQTGPFGSQLHQEDYVKVGTPMITVEHLGENRILHKEVPKVSDSDRDRLSRYLLRQGDIVFSRVGSVDRRALVRSDEDGWMFSGRCLRVRPDQAKIDSGYLSYFFGLPSFKEHVRAIAVGATMPSLNTSLLSELFIPYAPSTSEQRAIAHILGTLDDKIELNRRMSETLEAMARALFKSWFVDFDPVRAKAEGSDPGLPKSLANQFPDSFEHSELGEIPKGWRVKQLSDLCVLGRGASPRPINDYMNGEVPWVKIADATAAGGPFLFETKEKLKIVGVDKSVTVSPGDLILSNSATCGVPVFVELHGCIHDGWLYFKNLHSISKLYLFHVLIELGEHLVHIADGSVQKNLNTELVGRQRVLVPPQAVMAAFDKPATTWFTRMRDNGIDSHTLAALRDTLLPKLISGELRVEDAERVIHSSARQMDCK